MSASLYLSILCSPFFFLLVFSSRSLISVRVGHDVDSLCLFIVLFLHLQRTLFSGKLYQYKLPPEWTWYREDHDDKLYREKKTKETFQAGLQYLPFFLAESEHDPELVEYLRNNRLDPIRAQELPRLAWSEDKPKLEQATEAYLVVRVVYSFIR